MTPTTNPNDTIRRALLAMREYSSMLAPIDAALLYLDTLAAGQEWVPMQGYIIMACDDGLLHVQAHKIQGLPLPENVAVCQRAAQPPQAAPDAMPDDVREAIRYCWRWAQSFAEILVDDEERYRFACQEIDKVVLWLDEPLGKQPRPAPVAQGVGE